MKLDTFFEKLELLADAPNAVQKMRELVLKFAIRGRLTEQLETDGLADVLAKKINEDRGSFVKARKLTRLRIFDTVDGEDYPFVLPHTWTWTRLGNLCRVQAGFAFSSASFVQNGSGIPIIRIRDITKEMTQVNYSGEYRDEFIVGTGDYLVAMDGNFTVAKWRGPKALLNQRVSRLQWYSKDMMPSFFAIALQYRLSDLQGTKAYTTVDHLSSGQIEEAIVPLPPLAEQKRIVAKVDELMALCDRLEAQQQQRAEKHSVLARAAVSRFADAPTPANLDFIFHNAYAITPADLRKTILTLAVQGKLVPQNAKDESALLQSLTIKSASSKREVTTPFELPNNWQWVQLGQVSELINGDRSKNYPNKAEYVHSGVAWINTGHIEPDGTLSTESMNYITRAKFDSLRSGKVRNGDLVYCLRGATLGKTAIITQFDEGAIASSLVIVRLSSAIDPKFAYRVLISPLGREQIFKFDNGSAQPNLSANNVKKYWIPLPPLAEQKRIVAKVDELMKLVDQLESQLAASSQQAEQLMNAIVAELTTA